jgi:hypothetical protein
MRQAKARDDHETGKLSFRHSGRTRHFIPQHRSDYWITAKGLVGDGIVKIHEDEASSESSSSKSSEETEETGESVRGMLDEILAKMRDELQTDEWVLRRILGTLDGPSPMNPIERPLSELRIQESSAVANFMRWILLMDARMVRIGRSMLIGLPNSPRQMAWNTAGLLSWDMSSANFSRIRLLMLLWFSLIWNTNDFTFLGHELCQL